MSTDSMLWADLLNEPDDTCTPEEWALAYAALVQQMQQTGWPAHSLPMQPGEEDACPHP